MKETKTETTRRGSRPSPVSALAPPGPTRQATFYQLLVAARKQWFIDALRDALRLLDQATVKQEILEHALFRSASNFFLVAAAFSSF